MGVTGREAGMKNDRKVWKEKQGKISEAAKGEFLQIPFFLLSEIKLEIPDSQHWESLSVAAGQKENHKLLLLLIFLSLYCRGHHILTCSKAADNHTGSIQS